MTFEEAVKRLEEIVKELESDELTLEKSLALFEEGVTLSKTCQELLEGAEGAIEKLAGGRVEPFEEAQEEA